MTDGSDQRDKLGEVSSLATLVADRILEAQITERSIPPEQFSALVSAARLLQEHGVPWPPLVEQMVHEFGKRFSQAEAAPEAPASGSGDDNVIAGLTRFLGAFRREKGGHDEQQ